MLTYNIKENFLLLQNELHIDLNYDIKYRTFKINGIDLIIIYVSSLVDSNQIIEINKSIMNVRINKDIKNNLETIFNFIPHEDTKKVNKINDIIEGVLSGKILYLIEGQNEAVFVDTKKYPQRSIEEPIGESVIRGSHDGFVEVLNTNIALVRRRIVDKNLINESIKIGNKSPLNVCLSYIDGIADKNEVNEVRKRLNRVNIDNLILTDRLIEEKVVGGYFYPLARHTSRPDIFSIHLYRGKIGIIVDTSPNALIIPATFFDNITSLEEHRQALIPGTYLRIIRYIGIFISLFLTPLWYLVANKNIILPNLFESLIPDKTELLLYEIILGEIFYDFLRVSSMHTPNRMDNAISLISGVVLGSIAIEVGAMQEETILILAISSIGIYLTPSYELGLANKIVKYIFIIFVALFKIWGLFIAIILWIIYLSFEKSINKSYLYPLVPLNIHKLSRLIIRKNSKGGDKNGKT